MSWELGGRSFVVFRGRDDGRVYALAAHCAHMGTHLGHGQVVGDELRCPLHHWQWGGDGACTHVPGAAAPGALRQRTFAATERYGSVFLFNGPVPRCPPPELALGEDAISMLAGKPVRLRCHWAAVACNGFDMQHLTTVHGRTLRYPPLLERLDVHRLRMQSELSVTGRGLEDRVIRRLSANHVRLRVTCFGGTVVAVESDLGRVRSVLLLCLRPLGGAASPAVEIVPVFGVARSAVSAWDALRLRVARRLFTAFIRKDVAFMDDMRFDPGPRRGGSAVDDPVLRTFLEFLRELPGDDEEPAARATELAAGAPPLTFRGGAG